jgi:hypothetical protein
VLKALKRDTGLAWAMVMWQRLHENSSTAFGVRLPAGAIKLPALSHEPRSSAAQPFSGLAHQSACARMRTSRSRREEDFP